MESLRREFYQNIEAERARSNAYLAESKESSLITYNDKLERTKDELFAKIRDLERAHMDEVEQRMKLQQNIKETTDLKLDNFKRSFSDEIKMNRDYTSVSSSTKWI